MILPADFEEAWRQTVKREDDRPAFCAFCHSFHSAFLLSLTLLFLFRPQTGSRCLRMLLANAYITQHTRAC